MDARDRDVIMDYILDLKEPRRRMRKAYFAQQSYAWWAAKELLTYLEEHDDMSTMAAIEEFVAKMDWLSCLNPNTSYPFSVAKDIAEDIYDIFLAME